MKLDAIFEVKNNQLYKIEDNSVVDLSSLKKIEVKWSDIEIDDEVYNEEYLANLRDELKILENIKQFAILVPVVDKELSSAEQIERFGNAINHTARRVKDCVSVASIEIPVELAEKGNESVQDFMDLLAKKHPQYVYFSKTEIQGNLGIIKY